MGPKCCLGDFARYLYKSEHVRLELSSRVVSATKSHQRCSPEDISKLPIPWPSLPEQKAIVRYLDYVDGRICRYISARKKLVKLLEEQKRALIHRSVTRGLDPNVRLKPSGVEWLGDVPAHWEVLRFGWFGNFSKGIGSTKEDEVPEGIPCIRYGDLYTQHHFFIEGSRTFISLERLSAYSPLKFGDILFAGSGETIEEIGKSAVNLIEFSAYCGGDILLFRPNRTLSARFMGYITDSPIAVHQKSCMGRGVTVFHIYANQLKHLWCALPTLPEQEAIAEYLDKATANIDSAISRTRRQIELLSEYRTRLIADVVTGKLDVREAAEQLPDEIEERLEKPI